MIDLPIMRNHQSPPPTPPPDSILKRDALFRHFDNRRQIAAYAGLAPTPWQSGAVDREKEVSKAGNPRLRTERLFGTLQSRLPPLMRLERLASIEAANRWLATVYVPQHNARVSPLRQQAWGTVPTSPARPPRPQGISTRADI